MPTANYSKDIEMMFSCLPQIEVHWDGKRCIEALQSADYHWRQMEWIGFYFEYRCGNILQSHGFEVPGNRYGNVAFDSKRSINWDMKSSAIKSHSHRIILNDKAAIDESVDEYGAHGVVLALLDVEYNDESRSFQRWHSQLKGGLSQYERDRIARNATSRYRKTSAGLEQILLLVIGNENREYLDIHKQGRNADGSPRNLKYMLNIERAKHFEAGRIDFSTQP